MLKKVFGFVVVLSLLIGSVSASSINGDYKGYPIVNVMVNGKYVYGEVPAINLDGSTMIPLRAVIEALDAQISWDQKTYTAGVIKSADIVYEVPDNLNPEKMIELLNKVTEVHNGTNVKLVYDKFGSYVTVEYVGTSDVAKDTNSLYYLSTLAALTTAQETYVNYMLGGEAKMRILTTPEHSAKWLNQEISHQEYYSTWDIKTVDNFNYTPTTPQTNYVIPEFPKTQPSPQINNAPSCASIESQYEKEKRQKQAELAERKMSRGSIYEDAMKSIEDNKQKALKAAGCS